MEAQADVVDVAPRVEGRHGFWWGLSAGLIPNAVIFILYLAPWVEVSDQLAVDVLYAGPVVVALFGLVKMFSPNSRRCGVGLILAAPITVALWFVALGLDAWVSMGTNTPGP
ncbi:hypothetical protein [Nocardioides sp. MH1]|uniref:hypothetical protein n=1 Tax=Nocardioides sp. MH1 TaxID=3242490 RepID=UPI0035221575